jgi:hypothetical protein
MPQESASDYTPINHSSVTNSTAEDKFKNTYPLRTDQQPSNDDQMAELARGAINELFHKAQNDGDNSHD